MRNGQLESRVLTLVTLGLVAFGLVMVYSATSAAAALGDSDPGYYLKRQGTYAVVGIVLMVVASRTDFRMLARLAPGLLAVSLVLLVAVLVLGESVNGARRWLSFGPAVFQPSELAKLALAVWIATHLARRRAPQSFAELARPIGLLLLLVCALLLAEPDLGTSITIVLMAGGVLLVAGTPVPLLGGAGALVVALGAAAIWLEPYRRARLLSFLDPWNDADGAGYQTVQALIGMASGGFLGTGLGQGVQKVFYLPEAHTDMIFAIVGEELGLLGAAAVIGAFVVFGYTGLRIALRCRDPFGKRLAAGMTTLVCGQALVNLAAVMGIAPLTGIPLPFVSYGGSSLVVLLACTGVLLNIAVDDGRRRVARVPDSGGRDGRARPAGAGGRGRARREGSQGDVRRVAGSRRSAARS